MEAVLIKELFPLSWLCESGLVDNVELVVEEYRQNRGLLVGTGLRFKTHTLANRGVVEPCCVSPPAAPPPLRSGSSSGREDHRVQTDLWALQSPLHPAAGRRLWGRGSAGESPRLSNVSSFYHVSVELCAAFITAGGVCEEFWSGCGRGRSRGPGSAQQAEAQTGKQPGFGAWTQWFISFLLYIFI